MHKHFQLHIGAFLANFGDFIDRQFARQNDARHAHFLPKFHGRVIDRIGLNGQVNRLLRPLFAHHHDQTRIGHNQRVGLHGDHRLNVGHIGFDFAVVRQQIGGDVEFFAACVRLSDTRFQRIEFEFIVARTQRIAWLPRIHGVGAKIIGGTHLVQRTRWK